VKHAKQGAAVATAPAAVRDPSLDDQGLPKGYRFNAEFEITPRQVKQKLDEHSPMFFIDCRMPNEHAITHIEGATLIPLQQIQQHADKLRGHENDEVVVHCKSGGRSMQFVQILRQNGFKNAKSMAGGISLWNKDVNPGGPQY
jgi:rhodanese-related sulfurtransferase